MIVISDKRRRKRGEENVWEKEDDGRQKTRTKFLLERRKT